VFLTALVLLNYFVLNQFTLSEKTALNYNLVPNAECPMLYNQGLSPCYKGTMTFMQSTYTVLAFLGMCVFAVFGGVGLIVIPFDLICEFIYRPKPIKADEFKKRQRILLPRVLKLRTQGKKLDD
jgi:hypothetical protein